MKVKAVIIAALCCLLVAGQGIMAQQGTAPPSPPKGGSSTSPGTGAQTPPGKPGGSAAPGIPIAPDSSSGRARSSSSSSSRSSSQSSAAQEQAAASQAQAAAAQAAAAQAAAAQNQSAAASPSGPKSSLGVSVDVGNGYLFGVRYERVMGKHLAWTASGEYLLDGYNHDDKLKSTGDGYGGSYEVKHFNVHYWGTAFGLKYYFTSPLNGFYLGAGVLIGGRVIAWDQKERNSYGNTTFSGSSDRGGFAYGGYGDVGYRFLFGKFFLQPELRIHNTSADIGKIGKGGGPYENRELDGDYFFVGGGLTLGLSF